MVCNLTKEDKEELLGWSNSYKKIHPAKKDYTSNKKIFEETFKNVINLENLQLAFDVITNKYFRNKYKFSCEFTGIKSNESFRNLLYNKTKPQKSTLLLFILSLKYMPKQIGLDILKEYNHLSTIDGSPKIISWDDVIEKIGSITIVEDNLK